MLLPNTGRGASPAAIREFAALAEDAGVDSLWVGDHIALSGAQETEYPYADSHDASYEVPAQLPFLEAFTSLGFAAAVTSRCRLGLGVGILPYRHPLMWAKLAGTVQVLSEGRFDFGVGTGWMREEFDALGADHARRGPVSNATLGVLAALRNSSDGLFSFHGDGFDIREMGVYPSIRDPAPPPIWVGGNVRAAATRAARYGDVWFPHIYGMSPEVLGCRLRELQEEAVSFGRDVTLRAGVFSPLRLASDVTGDPWSTGTISGPPSYVADLLMRYRAAGIEHITLTFGGSPTRRIAVIEEVLDQFSG
ncbi:TIGR03619 family F420-dependent LLM class oxidoreductase [Pseudonocardia kunmingensis]|uniref:TIGR03619 family F420-dependent LLM class oxidoreductase n=1 Tax=Pseudonocardia kunmingensis TaxID=630975 RepID=UPI0014797584|nr:TIGR03619 family F420-dependent LLM class oxidoreductase [Pseudonocardia kunmingensis]